MPIRGAILDVDGTVVRGATAIPGARAGLETLAEAGVRRLFFSNNPTKEPAAYVGRFAEAGFDVTADEVLTAGSVTRQYLETNHAGDRVYLIGEAGLRDLLSSADVSLVDGDPTDPESVPEDVDVVLVSLDRSFGYHTLVRSIRVLEDPSVTLLGTDPDMVIPASDGVRPGSGAVINAVSGVAGRDPDRVLGKPSEEARRMALDALSLPAEECLVVGDRLDTDVALGARAGMTTALVRTGVTDDDALAAADVTPDYVLDSLAELDRVLDDGV